MKELNKHLSSLAAVLGLFLLLAFSACKKDKQNLIADNRNVTDTRKNSTVRIVNLAGYNQLQINGDTLTNYVVRDPQGATAGQYPGTKYFPDNGRLGTTWSIPQSFLTNGTASVMVEHREYQSNSNDPLALTVQEDSQQAFDYYLLPTTAYAQVTNLPKLIKIPRSIAAATDQSHFKVRILNLAGKVNDDPRMGNLVSPLTLTWADGTPVSSQTSNITPGNYSAYIDLPYCTAQFKVLTDQGVQVPGNGKLTSGDVVLEPVASTIYHTSLTYSPIKTYAPGGVYTIVVTPKQYKVPTPGTSTDETTTAYQNSFFIISDVAEPVNLAYARLQAVNAMPNLNGIKVTVNGQVLGGPIAYTGYTDYSVFFIGKYTIQATDGSGAVLASTTLSLDANTNFTLWVFPDANGKPVISALANDLSGTLVGNATDDATYTRNSDAFSFSMRFLNLCQDFPYLTLTTDNAQNFNSVFGFNTAAVTNLRPGIFPIEFPYIRANYDAKPYQIMAFRSSPSVVPGSWATDIPVLTGQALIARPSLYANGNLPNHEPGFYSIALVGSTLPSAAAQAKAKMIIVKHSK
ncbi:DUF4397 domain-containing protein [Mucilaginibacter paludis]|uniref:DUF4397 domain-containing protein n=1 Tax=Mucilaginibacter paludis DSM 18603 TaxID=714943 RepID=H1YBN6_9SPHI|nr:DUF4397 domain-containing protein [Mucilaginibacter paludis]EHQ25999.1 hypothetical protein Mucpa_1846 [Mucilaginibacter paludis DSM 18603]